MLILTIIILFFLIVSFWGFYNAIRPKKIVSDITPKDLGLSYKDVNFITNDGIKISGWFIPKLEDNFVNEKKAIILLHGYPADKGNILPGMSFLSKKYNLLFFDFRYFGKSEGKYSTVGAKEVDDLLAAISFLKNLGIEEIGVWGFSMGGAVALMTAKKAPEIKAIVSDSSYSSLHLLAPDIFRLPILRYVLAYFTGFWAKLFLKIDIKSVSPAESIKGLKIPILIIHSKKDEVIPFFHALSIKESLKENLRAEFWFEEDLSHGQLGEEYQRRIEEFFERNF